MKRRTTAIAIGAGLAAAVTLTVVLGAASFAITATPHLAAASSGSSATATAEAPRPTASVTPSISPTPTGVAAGAGSQGGPTAGAGAGAGAPGTAELSLTPGPIEIATTACMAARGYTWSNSVGVSIANAELAAVAASSKAGHALTAPETRALENAAAAAAAGVSAEAYPAFRTALTGDFANDASGCAGQAVSAADPRDALGADHKNFQAIQRACAADRGFALTAAQQLTLSDALQKDGEAAAAASVGWTLEQYRAYGDVDWGNTGAGENYHWEEAGCAGYATHATANDHNN